MKSKQTMPYFIGLCLFTFFIIFVCNSSMLQTRYSVDSYQMIYNNNNNISVHLRDCRYITAAIYNVLQLVGINLAVHQIVPTLIFMATISICIVMVYLQVKSFFSAVTPYCCLCVWLAVFLIYNNTFVAEWFLWPEISIMYSVAFIFSTLAAKYTANIYCEARDSIAVHQIFLAFFFLFLAIGSYQVILALYLVLSFLFIVLKYKFVPNRKVILSAFLCLVIGGVNSILNISLSKLLVSLHLATDASRNASFSFDVIAHNLFEIAKSQSYLWLTQMSTLPAFILIIFLVICFILLISVIRFVSPRQIVCIIGILVIDFGSLYLIHIVSGSIWISHRTMVPFWAFIASIIIIVSYFCSYLPFPQSKHRFLALSSCMVILACFVCTSMQQIYADHIANDRLDMSYAQLIQNQIDEYEAESGNSILYISSCLDVSPQYVYPGVKYLGYSINVKSILSSWADAPLINLTCGKNYQKKEMPSELLQYFQSKDWSVWNPEEQLFFNDDTLYICYY